MARHVLFACVDGGDLTDVAALVESACEEFVRDHNWSYAVPTVVNRRVAEDPSLRDDDCRDWDVGLNLQLPDKGAEPSGWFDMVEAIATFLGDLARSTGREFVIGIADLETGVREDLFHVNGP